MKEKIIATIVILISILGIIIIGFVIGCSVGNSQNCYDTQSYCELQAMKVGEKCIIGGDKYELISISKNDCEEEYYFDFKK